MYYSELLFLFVLGSIGQINILSGCQINYGKGTQSFHQNKVVAHRGAWKNTGAPQNSIASLKAAIELGCAGSEFDIHMTADSVLVVNHDADFFGLPVQNVNYDILLSKKLTNGESIPLLKDFIDLGKAQAGTKLVIEIKPSVRGKEWAMATAGKVVKMVHEMQAKDWCIYISFDYDILLEILRLDPKATVQYLGGKTDPETLKKDGIAGLDYHYNAFRDNETYISRAKGLGLQLNVWTVNTQERMDYFLEREFDFITTDEPEQLLNRVKAIKK